MYFFSRCNGRIPLRARIDGLPRWLTRCDSRHLELIRLAQSEDNAHRLAGCTFMQTKAGSQTKLSHLGFAAFGGFVQSKYDDFLTGNGADVVMQAYDGGARQFLDQCFQ
jgi:hypothetical protein